LPEVKEIKMGYANMFYSAGRKINTYIVKNPVKAIFSMYVLLALSGLAGYQFGNFLSHCLIH